MSTTAGVGQPRGSKTFSVVPGKDVHEAWRETDGKYTAWLENEGKAAAGIQVDEKGQSQSVGSGERRRIDFTRTIGLHGYEGAPGTTVRIEVFDAV